MLLHFCSIPLLLLVCLLSQSLALNTLLHFSSLPLLLFHSLTLLFVCSHNLLLFCSHSRTRSYHINKFFIIYIFYYFLNRYIKLQHMLRTSRQGWAFMAFKTLELLKYFISLFNQSSNLNVLLDAAIN
jgi:hypothetical protein